MRKFLNLYLKLLDIKLFNNLIISVSRSNRIKILIKTFKEIINITNSIIIKDF